MRFKWKRNWYRLCTRKNTKGATMVPKSKKEIKIG